MDQGPWIKLRIRYTGECADCKRTVEAGEMGWWHKSKKSILHEKCITEYTKPRLVVLPPDPAIREATVNPYQHRKPKPRGTLHIYS